MHHKSLSALTASLVLALPACSAPTDDGAADRLAQLRGVVFLALAEQPAAHIEARFDGTVVVDQAGCLRLDSADRSTVVWPHGSTLAGDEHGLRILDAGGREIGRIGGSFSFGGGHVSALHEGIAVTRAHREAAQASCPGDFWIVGDIIR